MKTSIKSLTIIFWTLFFTLPGVSQNVTGGLSAAASFNSIELKNTQTNIKGTENLIGVEGGVFLKIPIGGLYLRPMAVASYVKGTVSYANAESENLETD